MADVMIMPRLSLNEETNLLSQWYVSEGDKVSVGDKLFCIETDKSTLDVDSEFEGTVLKKYYEDYAVVSVLTPVCVIGQEGDEIPELEVVSEAAQEASEGETDSKVPEADSVSQGAMSAGTMTTGVEKGMKGISPRARKLAEQNGIVNYQAISASGAENRILEEDVIRYMREGGAEVPQATGEKKTIKLPKIRKVIAKNMMNSLQSSAQLTMTSIFHAGGVQALRAKFKAEQGDMKNVTIGDLILFATARTLAEFPYMNSWMVSDEEAIEFADVNLGCAVDTERGLMVPTIMAANVKSLLDISDDLKELAGQCRKGSISPDKLKEATFTVSNLGAFGIRSFTPILNPPQVGILGVGAIDYMAKQTKEGMLCYPACTLSLTVDHRLVDGGPAARFLKKLCENLEHIEELI
ncbi:MAG: 2-oxo acid dehydrogenase subunit E2 [Lachnospiraceae bacterium]|nr:2-oxo acid dehydrogenase subunit E2 [Lachnospiraceae bacterium]